MRKRLFIAAAIVLVQVWFLFVALPALAQSVPAVGAKVPVPAVGIPSDPSLPTITLPTSLSGYWDLVIAALAPIIVTFVSKYVPKLPKNLLPVVAPVAGVVSAHVLSLLTNMHLSWFDAAKAGALAVFVREVINQNVSKYLNVSWGAQAITAAPAATAPAPKAA